MKNILLFTLLTLSLFSSENYELKLYQNLLPTLFEKKSIYIYTQDAQQRNLFKESPLFILSKNCSDADMIIGKSFDNLSHECYEKPLFATTYRSFKGTKNAFGAFYWAKGRPQIQFKLKVVQKYNLHLPPNLSKYAK